MFSLSYFYARSHTPVQVTTFTNRNRYFLEKVINGQHFVFLNADRKNIIAYMKKKTNVEVVLQSNK